MGRSYTVIPDWMLDLGLDIWETVILATIYGFSQDGASAFTGSWAYLQRKACCSRRKVKMALDHLVELGLVTKQDIYAADGVKFCRYRYVWGSARDARGVHGVHGGGAPCAPNIKDKIDSPTVNDVYIDNNIQDIDKSQSRTHTRAKAAAFDFRKALIDLGVTAQVADDWLAVRKTKRATNTETAFRSIAAQIEKSGRPADDCIRFAAEHSWSGFRASWMNEDPDRPLAPARAQSPRKESIIEHYNRVNQELRERYGINRPDKQ